MQQEPAAKTYGWFGLYETFLGHPKWRLVAQRSGVPVVEVTSIVMAILTCAAKNRQHGWVGNFKYEECALTLEIPVEHVMLVYRALAAPPVGIGWIADSCIVNWQKRQPNFGRNDKVRKQEAIRQQNKRDRDDARERVLLGVATDEDRELIGLAESEILAKLAAHASRVTGTPPAAEPQIAAIAPFIPVQPKEDTHPARTTAAIENERTARAWLLGDANSPPPGYGPATMIVADNFIITRLNAELAIRHWLNNEMAGDVVSLAVIISAAQQQALNGDAFRRVVEGRISEYVREQTSGPTLPLGIPRGAIQGGRN